MKKINLVLLVLFIGGFAYGQSNKEDVDMIQAMYGKNKKDLVDAFMVIADTSKAAFWTTYDQYETERKTYGKKRIKLIEDYAKAYDNLNNKQAIDLMNKKLLLNADYGKLQKKYFDKFARIIGGMQAGKLFQLEDYLENNIRLAIQENIPFIHDIDMTKVKDATAQ